MKKTFSILCMMLFAMQFAFAQQILYVITHEGELSAYQIDEVTFDFSKTNTIDGHKFVDLGLPSGLLWAETNIGAETAADDGDYFAWGETEPKSDYTWDTYKFGTSNKLTKYNSTDGKTVLDFKDDAAYANWGASFRMPTYDDYNELRNPKNCTLIWISMPQSNGSSIYGYKVSSTKNGNSIFLPASGFISGSDNSDYNSRGSYWTSTVGSLNRADSFTFTSSIVQIAKNRFQGLSVRPVAEQ